MPTSPLLVTSSNPPSRKVFSVISDFDISVKIFKGRGIKKSNMWFLFLMACTIQGILSSKEPAPRTGNVNPEAYMNVSEIIHRRGYCAEEYEEVTPDGYILTVNRIPCDRILEHEPPKPVVLLQHGFALEGSSWVANMPNNSLGFMLADAGYDVWIGNNRGNSWSRKHQKLTANQEQYFAYSFDEMAKYDLPFIISFIVEKSRMPKLHFVGFSQGATQGFITFSSMPHIAENIRMFHALAPLSTLKNPQSPFVKLLFASDGVIKTFLGKKDFSLRSEIKREVITRICSSKVFNKLCSWVLSVVGGSNEKNLNMSRIDVYMSHFPDSTSVQNLLHWGQIHKTGKFRAFDYGSKNMARYNQTEPLSYNLERLNIPTTVWYGEKDWFADPDNVKPLICRVRKVVRYGNNLSN
ncbi:lipase member M-like [Rhineura floridana]|uniref:lipase member M-like n=1 Tax=Rhineura floridana TaxID=261503 RepID=UPI002AC7F068|nr:lipase member M-like [Rhineura floridana]